MTQMIQKGDLVVDWMGRAGIAVDKTTPPDGGEFDPIFDWPLREMPGTATWWSVALFSGAEVKTPELLTDSYGKSTVQVLRMAAKHSKPDVKSKLLALSLVNDTVAPMNEADAARRRMTGSLQFCAKRDDSEHREHFPELESESEC